MKKNRKFKRLFLFRRFLYYFYGEKFYNRLNFDWSNKPSRIEIIQSTIERKNYRSYLEIGCAKDKVFSKIIIEKKVGVDPVSGGTVRLASDEFFKINKDTFDCIFVDGLHIYEQVKKDIHNSLAVLNPNGVIFVHDCLPNKIWEQNIPVMNGAWTGDVWKAIPELRTLENVDSYTCIADRGIGIILKRKNQSKINPVANFKKLKYKDYYNNCRVYMNLIDAKDLTRIF
jgi:hypothetical protein